MVGSRGSVVFGALALRPTGSGVQTYARELMAAVATSLTDDHEVSAVCQSDCIDTLPPHVRAMSRPVADGVLRALEGLAPMPRTHGVFHSLDVDLPAFIPAATVATVHDLSVFDTPWAFPGKRVIGERLLVKHALTRADALIAVSAFTADRIQALFGRTATVTTLAPARWATPPSEDEVTEVRKRHDLPDTFVLQVGTVEPRKDVALLAQACQIAGVQLVLAGAGSRGSDAPSNSHGLGYVDLDELPALYAAASVTAYVSKYEGFGLPPVEAMSCGGAVAASAVGALPDVVNGGAVLVNEHTPDAWAKVLTELSGDSERNRELRELGVKAASELSWDSTAANTIEVYRDLGLAA